MIDLGRISLDAARGRREQLRAEAQALDTVISALEAYLAVRDGTEQPDSSGAAASSAAARGEADLARETASPIQTPDPELVHLRDGYGADGLSSPGGPSVPAHACDGCERMFKTPAALGSHRRVHFDAAMRRERDEQRPERNPRSVPPLELAPRLDQAVGE